MAAGDAVLDDGLDARGLPRPLAAGEQRGFEVAVAVDELGAATPRRQRAVVALADLVLVLHSWDGGLGLGVDAAGDCQKCVYRAERSGQHCLGHRH